MFTIENAFNKIWRVSRVRIGRRLVYYWLVILLGPLLLALGFLVSSYLLSTRLWVEHVESAYQVYDILIGFLPLILSAMAFSLMYYFLPSCKVKLLHAVMGGVIAAGLLESCKIVFVHLLTNMPSYQIVYGAFAVVPLFLIWVFIAWCVVLLGAEIVRGIPFIQKRWSGKKASQLDWGLYILKRLSDSNINRVSRDKLASALSFFDADEWELVLRILIDHGWVLADLDEFELSVDLDTATVGELSEMINGKRLEKIGVISEASPWFESLSPLLAQLMEQKKAALGLPISRVISGK
jgi:membrane protein